MMSGFVPSVPGLVLPQICSSAAISAGNLLCRSLSSWSEHIAAGDFFGVGRPISIFREDDAIRSLPAQRPGIILMILAQVSRRMPLFGVLLFEKKVEKVI